jgi:glycerol-3-phosphate acyltransferase PlsY
MNALLQYVCMPLGGYLVGSIPFGILVARLKGVDITKKGSGNIGATNVGRLLGWRFGILVFCLDFAKGAVPAALAMSLSPRQGDGPSPTMAGVLAGLGAFLGHLFSLFLRLRGGKGVATGAGVVFVLLPLPTLAALATWVVVLCSFRFVSLASLAAAVVLYVVCLAQAQIPLTGDDLVLTVFCALAVGLVFVKHSSNIHRLVRGGENRLAESSAMQTVSKIIHVLAVGLWFGMAVFFSFPVALTLFSTFENEAKKEERETWFPQPADFKRDSGIKDFDLQKDQGTRAAGFAISPLFGHYFLWQGICGFLATLTALGWPGAEPGRRVHRIRVVVLILAVVTVILGWPIERKVSELRNARNEASDRWMAILKAGAPNTVETVETKQQVVNTRQEFVTWHLWSLLLNFVTIALVTVAMAQTAMLPANNGGPRSHPVAA